MSRLVILAAIAVLGFAAIALWWADRLLGGSGPTLTFDHRQLLDDGPDVVVEFVHP